MHIDHDSLLVAIAFSSGALFLTLVVTWLQSRQDAYLFRISVAALLVAVCTPVFGIFREQGHWLAGATFFPVLLAGMAYLFGAALEFRSPGSPPYKVAIAAAAAIIPVSIPFIMGFDGLAFIFGNLGCSLLLLATAWIYFRQRAEAPRLLAVNTLLYAATGVSFALCAWVVASETPLRLVGYPDNWAEDLNAVIAIVGVAGCGAISMSLNHARAAARHRKEALTDALTGLMNRRALFEKYGGRRLPSGWAVLLLDLDSFKSVNDTYGHDAGDEVLRRAGYCIGSQAVMAKATAARLGGEEFALVLEGVTPSEAIAFADRLRGSFAMETFVTPAGPIRCTMSIGVAHSGDGASFDDLLNRADKALYVSKEGGRNRVSLPAPKVILGGKASAIA